MGFRSADFGLPKPFRYSRTDGQKDTGGRGRNKKLRIKILMCLFLELTSLKRNQYSGMRGIQQSYYIYIYALKHNKPAECIMYSLQFSFSTRDGCE